MQYPSKNEGKELKIVIQPETQHRARYLTEGSRGSVKDRDQQGFPTVKVIKTPDRLQVVWLEPEASASCQYENKFSLWIYFEFAICLML